MASEESFIWSNDVRRKLYMVGTYSTVEKQAKRVPDPTVKTTNQWTSLPDLLYFYLDDFRPKVKEIIATMFLH